MGYGGGAYGGGFGVGAYNRPPGAFGEESLTARMEQSTQRTFQTLEQIVQAFSGLAQMLESTFFATHSSFMAMVGVAEQFGNMREYLGSVFSLVSLYKGLRGLLYRLAGKQVPVDPASLSAEGFIKETGPLSQNARPKSSSRPFWVFMMLVIGLPWLMSKLINRMNQKRLEEAAERAKLSGQDPVPGGPIHPSQLDFAKALYEFSPSSPAELTLAKGQIIAILEKLEGGWWRGRTQTGEIGYFPANRVEIIDKSGSKSAIPLNPSLTSTVVSPSDASQSQLPSKSSIAANSTPPPSKTDTPTAK